MKVVLASTDLSLVQSAQIALDVHGIDLVLSDDNLAGLPSSPTTITIRNDADLELCATVGPLARFLTRLPLYAL